jgi:hypothetical protein
MFSPLPPQEGPLHLFLCIADHYEPDWNHAPWSQQCERVDHWLANYPESLGRFTDSVGRPPQHTFFYPAEVYNGEHLEKLARLCRRGFGDVEVHLHHRNDTSENLRETLLSFTERLFERHGLLQKDDGGQITYGFIHGNWALDNSLPGGCWCGVNDELTVLRETGCYADFTLPSAPSPAQTMTVNSIYYATDDPLKPKSHEHGVPAEVGKRPPDNALLLIQGPLALDWRRRKYGILPGIENADLHGSRPPDPHRLKQWLRASVHVLGRPQWRFIKLHTHGAKEINAEMLLGEPMRQFHEHLAALARQRDDFHYYYVTAREMAELVHQAERGESVPRLVTSGVASL